MSSSKGLVLSVHIRSQCKQAELLEMCVGQAACYFKCSVGLLKAPFDGCSVFSPLWPTISQIIPQSVRTSWAPTVLHCRAYLPDGGITVIQ